MASWMVIVFLLLVLRAQITEADLSPCYWPGETQVESHTPCNESASASHCCVSSDACISNGYCFQQGNADQWGNRLARASCTDPTFKAPGCPYYCGDVGEGYSLALLLVNNSANGSFCCSNGYDASTDQCGMVTRGSNKAFKIPPGQVIWDRRTGSIDPPVDGAVYATVRETSTSTVLATATAMSQDGHKTTAVAAGIAVPLGSLLALALVSLWLMWRRLKMSEKEKNTAMSTASSPGLAHVSQPAEAYQLPGDSNLKHEAETDAVRCELANENKPVEVPGGHYCEVEGDGLSRAA